MFFYLLYYSRFVHDKIVYIQTMQRSFTISLLLKNLSHDKFVYFLCDNYFKKYITSIFFITSQHIFFCEKKYRFDINNT